MKIKFVREDLSLPIEISTKTTYCSFNAELQGPVHVFATVYKYWSNLDAMFEIKLSMEKSGQTLKFS